MNGFGFRQQARRPGMYFALGMAMLAIYLSVTLQMDVVVIALAAMTLALVLRRLVLNPARGFRFSQNAIDWVSGNRARRVPFEKVQGVSIGKSPGGETVCVLRLTSGETAPLPGVERVSPSDLIHEFGLRGIPVQG